MSFVFDMPEELGGESTYLEAEGKFHFTVTGVFDGTTPPDKDGNTQMLKGGGFSSTLEVLEGPHKGKKLNLRFYNGDLNHKDKGLMSRKKQAAFLIACDCVKTEDLGKRGVSINLTEAVGSQVIAEVESEQYNDDEGKARTSMRLVWDKVYHVDDPRVASVPKDKTSIDSIPKANRHPAEYFASLTKKATPVKRESAPAQSRVTDEELADIL